MPEMVMVGLQHGSDIMEAIRDAAADLSIYAGFFSVIGALSSVDLAYYDQKEKVYRQRSFEGEFEIASCTGNISLKDGQRFVHAHIALADKNYNLFGGHLLGGRVFAAELHIMGLEGEPPVREYDPVTGLFLWRRS
ncbi:PPC domain-containing DNA-binding protein [Methanothrix sp.]|uniref:PPC domain-containing DNA-binding protein n=1 Tax=Methanothrix sp. TaxID=90426 RepID=UPI0034E27F46